MATRLLNLQGVLFLNHNIQWLLIKYDDDRYLYLSIKVAKIDLITLKIAISCYFVWLRVDCCHDNYVF